MENEYDFELKEASPFYLLMTMLPVLGILLTLIWAFSSNNVGGGFLAIIFGLMILLSLVIGQEILQQAQWKHHTVSYTLGFLGWIAISTADFTVLSVGENRYYSTLAGQIPNFQDTVFTGVVIPIAEELLWTVAIPIFVFSILGSDQFDFSEFTQYAALILISTTTFALFHVENIEIIGFLIAAGMFRLLMIATSVADTRDNFLPWVEATPAFAIGAHMANNLSSQGIGNVLDILLGVSGFQILVSLSIIATITILLLNGLWFIGKNTLQVALQR